MIFLKIIFIQINIIVSIAQADSGLYERFDDMKKNQISFYLTFQFSLRVHRNYGKDYYQLLSLLSEDDWLNQGCFDSDTKSCESNFNEQEKFPP